MDTIEVQIQKFSYGNVQVLKQIQFTVPEGTFVSFWVRTEQEKVHC